MEPGPEDFQPYIHPIGPDFGLPVMKDFNPHYAQYMPSSLSDPGFYQNSLVSDFRPLLKVDEYSDIIYNQRPLRDDCVHPPTTQIQPAEIELQSSWPLSTSYPLMLQTSNSLAPTSNIGGIPFLHQPGAPVSPPHSNYHFFDDAALRTPWSSPEYMPCEPLSTNGDEDELTDDKPYAKLIWEALMEAPRKRMMLRDIYEWFRQNTTKTQDNATNGWQNSIRHNLSMNKAFENDREQGRGNARKANSVWVLTEDAIQNGVQSTTRYRKSGGGKRPLTRAPALQRQRSGARGGRAARRSARYRRQAQLCLDHPTPSSYSPDTPSYSDISDCGLDNQEFRPAFRSCPLTPLEGHAQLAHDATHHMHLHTWNPVDLDLHHTGNGAENTAHMQNPLLSPRDNQYMGCMGDVQMSEI
ncbi:uncharacterized protein A1O9_06953 [Exophiala aquamarina CBS 119918]|uniref:Fork-head domain-containing protein n=1 Tax=Exophiala aquamarina CBS 119918 TaxID=1182545 RepID=A0A072PBY5_9EURO|nr:uncharacterized protein A1O9_06953 [Exophiala aquamarina CBS 119918]KEF56763.1 hypothetical protein A1O9_06953 [Exophiala aquamarina CBS 119918]